QPRQSNDNNTVVPPYFVRLEESSSSESDSSESSVNSLEHVGSDLEVVQPKLDRSDDKTIEEAVEIAKNKGARTSKMLIRSIQGESIKNCIATNHCSNRCHEILTFNEIK
ncbi:unnamed protein product, partial [Owenia fusiformis]